MFYDPCPLYGSGFDLNLKENYGKLFINPPYSNIKEWVNYAIEYNKQFNHHVVLLIPSRTDTRYFHKLLEYGVSLEFIKGRLKFGGMKGSAPFPSVLVHINEETRNKEHRAPE